MNDIWSNWLKLRRFGGDEDYQRLALEHVKAIAQKLVEKALISDNMTVLDVGAGDGLLGLMALDKLGINGKVILSDFSEGALSIPKSIFTKANNDPRIEFLICHAENLELPSNSIDRVLMRAVLLYVDKKQDVFSEIYRVLKPGGIAVLLDPINKRNLEFSKNYFRGFSLDKEPLLKVKPLILRISSYLEEHIPLSFINYNEHDLFHYSINSGFLETRLEYYITYNKNANYVSANSFLDVAPNPHSPSIREVMHKILNNEEFMLVDTALNAAVKQSALRVSCEAIILLKK